MKSFVAILALAAAALASPTPFEKYQDRSVLYPHLLAKTAGRRTPGHRIVGGNEATPHAFPFITALFIDEQYFCGGSILDENNVLTAAHCCDGAASVRVVAGAHNVREDEPEQQTVMSGNIVVHENWGPIRIINDICIVQLATALVMDENVQAVERAGAEPAVGEFTTAIGWGKPSDSAGGISDVLRFVEELPVIADATCSLAYGGVDDKFICISAQGGHGTCNGDSGGPLVDLNMAQVGLTSFGSGLGCEAGLPDAFSSLIDYADWIDANMA